MGAAPSPWSSAFRSSWAWGWPSCAASGAAARHLITLDLGVRIQDRLLSTLSQLVVGMTTDGVELVSDTGVPLALNPAAPQSSSDETSSDEPG